MSKNWLFSYLKWGASPNCDAIALAVIYYYMYRTCSYHYDIIPYLPKLSDTPNHLQRRSRDTRFTLQRIRWRMQEHVFARVQPLRFHPDSLPDSSFVAHFLLEIIMPLATISDGSYGTGGVP